VAAAGDEEVPLARLGEELSAIVVLSFRRTLEGPTIMGAAVAGTARRVGRVRATAPTRRAGSRGVFPGNRFWPVGGTRTAADKRLHEAEFATIRR
jgi:hypothetical protein